MTLSVATAGVSHNEHSVIIVVLYSTADSEWCTCQTKASHFFAIISAPRNPLASVKEEEKRMDKGRKGRERGFACTK